MTVKKLAQPRFPGIKVMLGRVEYVLAPLSTSFLELNPDIFERADAGQVDFQLFAKAITSSLQRNYSDLAEDDIKELIDIGNAPGLFAIVMDVSGLIRSRLAEEQKIDAGKSDPVADLTSWSSTLRSQLAPDTPSTTSEPSTSRRLRRSKKAGN